MAEKTGVFNGVTVGLTGTTKAGKAYTIYNINIQFPTGKVFKLNAPSWGDVYKSIKDLPIGTGIKCEVDDRNNITDYKVTAPVGAASPPVQFPQGAPQQPTPGAPAPAQFAPIPSPPVAIGRAPVMSTFGFTDRDLRVMAIKLAVDFYKGAGTQKEKIATEELVLVMAARVVEFMSLKPKPMVTAPGEMDNFDETNLEIPPVTPDSDDIPF